MKKMTFIFLIVLCGVFAFAFPVQAVEQATEDTSTQEIYESQLEDSGANSLIDNLPKDAQDQLQDLNISSPSWEELNSLSFGELFMKIISMAGEQSKTPISVAAAVLAVVLLTALLDNFKQPFGAKPLGSVADAVTTLLISTILIFPIVTTIGKCANIISVSTAFMFAYVPVLVGIMIASGQATGATSYYYLMLGAGQVVNQVSTNLLIPFLNIFLGLSVTCSITPTLKLEGICQLISKITKWVLTFAMSLFVAILTFQTILSSAADSTGLRAARFAISSFVPIVGGALSEAFLTVQGCVKMLKSGVGIFAILGSALVFLPVILECVCWSITINISTICAEVFDLPQPAKILKSVGLVVNTLIAILLCVMTIFIISTAIILTVGGG